MVDDKSLMLQFQNEGASAAFEELFRRNKDGLFRFLLRLCGNQAIAEDISQQTWLKIIELAEAAKYAADERASFKTFLFTLARNRYIDQEQRSHGASRTQAVEQATLERVADDDILAPDRLTNSQQTQVLISEAISSLPTEQREVLLMWMHGVELVELARLTGTPWATLVSRKKYALHKIKLYLDNAGIKDASDVIT